MDAETRREVRQRGGNRCEYCRLPQAHTGLTHHIEHIRAKRHGGTDDPENLALACHRCNNRKGPNIAGIDPMNDTVSELFHPRRDGWADHFVFQGARIEGATAVGRATVQLLGMNDARRVELRSQIMAREELG
jgi:hypothetical protein